MSKIFDNSAYFSFAQFIYKDVQAYISEHKSEFEEWQRNENTEHKGVK